MNHKNIETQISNTTIDPSALQAKTREIQSFQALWLGGIVGFHSSDSKWVNRMSDDLILILTYYRFEVERKINGFEGSDGWLETIRRSRVKALLMVTQLLTDCEQSRSSVYDKPTPHLGRIVRRFLLEAADQFAAGVEELDARFGNVSQPVPIKAESAERTLSVTVTIRVERDAE
jgi:hypothetical protein